MATDLGIANHALLALGITKTLASLTEASNESRVMNSLFSQTRDELLMAHNWNFARRRSTLVAHATAPPTNWDKAWAVPSGFLFAHSIVLPGMLIPTPQFRIPFETVMLGTSPTVAILTNTESAELIHTYQAASSIFTSTFSTALSYLLALRAATPLTGKMEVMNTMFRLYQHALGQAVARDLTEGYPGPDQKSDLITARLNA